MGNENQLIPYYLFKLTHELHDHNTRQKTISNYKYQSAAESHKQLQDIAIGDKVLIRVHQKRFSLGTLRKLHSRRSGSYKAWRDLVPTPTSSIFLMILGSAGVPRRGPDTLSHFHDVTVIFSSSIAATTAKKTRYWWVCALLPGSILSYMSSTFTSSEFFEAGENWWESLALYLYLGFPF